MYDRAEMAERHGRILTELSELGASLARKVHAQAMEAETPDETASLTTAFHRISRSVRQTLALELRLKRELERAEREARTQAREDSARRTERRKARVSTEIERVLWDEYEAEKAEGLAADLCDLLKAEALDEDFLSEPLEAQINRICRDLGVPSPFVQSPDPPPQGEGNREAVEEASAQNAPLQVRGGNPLTGSAGAPPEGEQLEFDASD